MDGGVEAAPAWYDSAEATTIADRVLNYQTRSGGWPKNHDMTQPPDAKAFGHEDVTAPTIDNGATYTQIRFLARVAVTHPEPRYRDAVRRGLEYLLAAQYENGGWPQFYPLIPGYYTHITFNDDAMIGVLQLLRDVPAALRLSPGSRNPCGAVRLPRSKKALPASCGVRSRVGERRPSGVRSTMRTRSNPFRPANTSTSPLSGYESVGIVRFLLGVKKLSPEIMAAVQAAIIWFERVKLTGIRIELVAAPELPHGQDRRVVPDPAAPPLWARFYEIGTDRPIFGGRDTIIRYSLAEVAAERRAGYRWYVDDPRRLLERDYPAWAAKWLPKKS